MKKIYIIVLFLFSINFIYAQEDSVKIKPNYHIASEFGTISEPYSLNIERSFIFKTTFFQQKLVIRKTFTTLPFL